MLAEDEQKETAKKEEKQEEADSDKEDADHEEPPQASSDKPEDPYFIPMADHLLLNHGPKPLTAVALDPSGSRVATGGFDFEVKLWDFSGMDKSCRAFKVFQPSEDQQIKHIEFSPTGMSITFKFYIYLTFRRQHANYHGQPPGQNIYSRRRTVL